MTPARPAETSGAICRDCLSTLPSQGATLGRCPACGSPRLLNLAAAAGLSLAHVDCDAFYASVEKRDRPELADKPVIVGGGGRRGVVSTACYIARTWGVRSAMPMASALKLCPEAIVLPPDMAKYARVGREIRERMFELTPLVEPISIDEAFLDLAGCEAVHGMSAAETLAKFAHRIELEIGVTVSVGLSYCKFLSKLASDMDKPRGFAVIGRQEAMERLAPLGVGRLWGVGKVAEERFNRLGLRKISDLQALDEPKAVALLGEDGRRLWRLARGVDERKVEIERDAKSLSAEITFDFDVADRAELERTLLGLCERVAARLKKAELSAGGITLKLRTPDFKLRTRTRSGFGADAVGDPAISGGARAARGAAQWRALSADRSRAADLRPGHAADESDLIEGDRTREKARSSRSTRSATNSALAPSFEDSPSNRAGQAEAEIFRYFPQVGVASHSILLSLAARMNAP